VVELAQLGGGPVGAAAGLQQLALVAATVDGVEDGDADELYAARLVAALDGVDEDGQRPSAGAKWVS
jgi:hypothetical protein